MKPWVELCSRAARTLVSWFFSFVLWTFWLALVLLLVFQLYIVSANELAIPGFVLRHLESRLAASGLRATFSRTSFDPTGRVLVENVRLSLAAFPDPVVTARSVYVRLNPWPLVVGRIEPREIELTDVSAAVPAMLSATGHPAPIVQHLDASLEPGAKSVTVRQLSGHIAGVTVSARGTLVLGPGIARKPADASLSEVISQKFAGICRQALVVAEQAAQFDQPSVQLEFAPSESGAPIIGVQALARGARLTKPVAVEAVDLRVATRLLLFGDAPPSDVEIAVRELRLPAESTVRGLQARVVGRIRVEGGQFDLREVALTVDAVTSAGVTVDAVSAEVFPRALPALETNLVANVLDAPLAVHAEADLGARVARAQFRGTISPQVLDVISRHVKTNVRKFYDFETVLAERGEVRFGPGWAFEKLAARVRVPRMNSYGVLMEDGRAVVELDRNRFYSPEASARVGADFAHGSYEHDLQTHEYRFLLDGRLRPLEISEWFRDWWSNFFQQLQFPIAPPEASVDVRGTWRDSHYSNVFVFADALHPVIRGTPLDRVRTRIFIRPAFFDGLEILAASGDGDAHGRFTYIGNPETHAWHTLELGLDSTLDLKVAGQLLGPLGAKSLEPFRLDAAPVLTVRGQFAGPDAPGGARDKLHIVARTTGGFRFHEFPLQDVSFTATLERDDVALDNVSARFAGGVATGHARVWGAGEERRLGFDFTLDDASLGQVASGVGDFFAAQKGQAPAPPGKFVQEKANVRLNLAASAEGRYADPMSYRGEGSAVLRGAEIGEVPLLGTLSELLKFTALRFTEARANFKIEGSKLVFPTVTLRGANSAIDAHGTYALDRRELEFNAKLFPFQESESIIKTVVGAVLTPLSNAFEVKLSGSLAKPHWAFVMGPTNFLRSLGPGTEANGKAGAGTDAGAASDPAPGSSKQDTPPPTGL